MVAVRGEVGTAGVVPGARREGAPPLLLVAGLLLLHQLALTLVHFVLAPTLGIAIMSAGAVILTIFAASALMLAIVALDLRQPARARAVFCSKPCWDRATAGLMLLAFVIAQLPLLYLAVSGKTVWQSGAASRLAVGQALRGSLSTVSGLGLLIATVLVAPLVEEVLYRGYLLGGLVVRMPPAVAVAVSAVLFVTLHAEASNLIAALCLGVGTAVAAVRTQSVVPGLVVHVANNAFGMWYATLT